MKNLFLTVAFMLFSFGLFAQRSASDASFVEKQYPGDQTAARVTETAIAKMSNDKTSAARTTWLANRPRDNWFFSLEGGVNHLFSENHRDFPFKENLNWTGGLAIGKWFSPVWGLRISGDVGKLKGYQPNPSSLWYVGQVHQRPRAMMGDGSYVFNQPEFIRECFLDEDGNHPFSYADVTADFLVNLKNLFRPYNPKGVFNPVLYGGVGYAVTLGHRFDPFGTSKSVEVGPVGNLALKGGLQLNFRLSDPVQLYVAGEGLLVPENFDRYSAGKRTYEGVGSLKLGLTYNFPFRHFIKAELRNPAEIAALNREINELRNRPQVVCPPVPACPPCPEQKVVTEKKVASTELEPVFFQINSHVVRNTQMTKVAHAAEYLNDHPQAKLELVSYADKKTATAAYNLQLSKKRTDAVAKVLINQFGIDKKRLILTHKGDTVQPFNENDLNRVTIFVK